MQKWEYDYMLLDGKWDEICHNLNAKGLQGWELVTVANRLSLTKVTGPQDEVDRTKAFPVAIQKRPLVD